MTSFSDQVRGFAGKVRSDNEAVVAACGVIVQSEVTVGGPISSAPGQPVRSGALRLSFIPEFITPLHWRTSTNLPYAEAIENGVGPHGPLTLRSSVGGFRSVAHIAHNFDRIVEHATRSVRGAS